MSIRTRISELKKHVCFIDPRTNSCWKCRALARYNNSRVYLTDDATRTRTLGNYHAKG